MPPSSLYFLNSLSQILEAEFISRVDLEKERRFPLKLFKRAPLVVAAVLTSEVSVAQVPLRLQAPSVEELAKAQ